MRASFLWVLAVLSLIVLSATGCFHEPKRRLGEPLTSRAALSRHYLSYIHEQASGYFVKDAPADFTFRNGASLRFEGMVSHIDLPSHATANLKRIVVYGATGDKTADELRSPAHRLQTVELGGNTVDIGVNHYDSDWISDPMWTTDDVYSVLEVYTIVYQHYGPPELFKVERRRTFTNITADLPFSYVVQGDLAHQDGGTSATITCAGSFFSGQGLAMYDVTVAYDNLLVNGLPTDLPLEIEIFAGPTEATMVQLPIDPLILPDPVPMTYTWSGWPHIVGAYSGEEEMSVRVDASFADPQHAPSSNTYRFSDLHRRRAVQIPGH